jgi:large subunit ribosomal protein L28
MTRKCEICGKGPVAGRSISRRGLPKKKGGIGLNITGVSKRVFLPNLQMVKVINNGTVRRKKVCTKCIKSGSVVKA